MAIRCAFHLVVMFVMAVWGGGCVRSAGSSAAGAGGPGDGRCEELARLPKPDRFRPLERPVLAYPPEFKRDRVEGHVVVEFSVTPEGKTDEFVILESQPPGVFDDAALTMLYHFRYCPSDQVDYPPRMKMKFPFRLR